MQNYRGIITLEPGKRGGKPCIRHMRITVYDILGCPPKIVWLRYGNATVDEIEKIFRLAAPGILALEIDPDVEVVEVW